MKNQILEKTMPAAIEEKGTKFLGIPTGISGRSFSITKLVDPKKTYGWIIKGESITEWRVSGIIQKEGSTFVYGPYFDGEPLEAILDSGPGEALSRVLELAAAFSLLAKKNIEVTYSATNCVLFLSGGGILLLPPQLMREIVTFLGQEEKILLSEACNHPDYRGEKRLSFFLGSIMYRIITGEYPFTGKTEEDVRYEIRNRITISAAYKNPRIKREVSEHLMAASGRGTSPVPSLDEWVKALSIWLEEGIERDVSEEEASRIILEGRSLEEKSSKLITRKRFWEKNRIRYATIAGVSVLIGIVLWTTLGNTVFRTRKTRGFPPLKVVETYYESMNTLDVMLIGDCVLGDAGKSDVETVANLYVISKPMNPYDTSFQFVSAAEWDKKGRPRLDASASLYGITTPQITKVESESTLVFDAKYERWFTEKDPDSANWELSLTIHGVAIEERLFLKLVGKDWLIYKIDRLSEKPLEWN